MSKTDIDRHDVLRRLIRKEIKHTYTAQLLKLTAHHVTLLKQAVIAFDTSTLIHKQRGKPSHHQMPKKKRTRIASLLKEKYLDFGPTLAAEKLRELHSLCRASFFFEIRLTFSHNFNILLLVL